MIARLLIAPLSARKAEIDKILSLHLSGVNLNHPDIFYFSAEEKLGIAEARKIKSHFSLKPYSAKGRAVVLEDASKLTIEAQNALLKTLEELPKEAVFILGASSDDSFLPTILSRCQIIRLQIADSLHTTDYSEEIENLFLKSIEEKFEFIETLKDREEFLHSLVAHFRLHLRLHLSGVNLNFGKELLQAEQWAKQNVNIRAILEYLMLVMPKK